MSSAIKRFGIGGAAAIACLLVGYFAGARAAESVYGRLQDALLMSDASLDTSRFLVLLTLHREGKGELAAQRLEIMLDTSVLDLARAYSPTSDSDGKAAQMLRAAAQYRSKHPANGPLQPAVSAALAPFAPSAP